MKLLCFLIGLNFKIRPNDPCKQEIAV